jgi:hypothetical protein
MNVKTPAWSYACVTTIQTAISAICLALFAPHAAGQIVHTAKAADLLKKQVTLAPRPTTLRNAVSALSEQTGLKIEAEEYLADRKMSIYSVRESAAAALDAIAELNGYVWRETDDLHIVVTRPSIQYPTRLSDAPAAIRAAMPVDFARYLGIGVTVDNLAPIEDKAQARSLEMRRRRTGIARFEIQARIESKIASLIHKECETLYTPQTARPLMGAGIPFSKLTPIQQSALSTALLLQPLIGLSSGTAYYLMYNQLTPYQQDPLRAALNIRGGNGLEIGTETVTGDVSFRLGFGAPIAGLQPNGVGAPGRINP